MIASKLDKGPIDFVVTWVDGSDPDWLREKKRYESYEQKESWNDWTTGEKRYRDWGLLKYWFRGVEQYAPWVRRVFFVTWGHVPSWLNTSCEKLRVVRHDEYIPTKWLPTFNSHCIELNLHRIADLSEQFVYFNDDTFLTDFTGSTDFFEGGLPKDEAGLCVSNLSRKRTSYVAYSAMILNDHFDFHAMVEGNLWKWINIRYGFKNNIRTLSLLPHSRIPGMYADHLPISYLKSTFEEVWEKEGDELSQSSSDRFRQFYGISPWLIRDWQRAKGDFVPRSSNFGRAYVDPRLFVKPDAILRRITADIKRRRTHMICINDEIDDEETFQQWKSEIAEAFESVLPEKSQFER